MTQTAKFTNAKCNNVKISKTSEKQNPILCKQEKFSTLLTFARNIGIILGYANDRI